MSVKSHCPLRASGTGLNSFRAKIHGPAIRPAQIEYLSVYIFGLIRRKAQIVAGDGAAAQNVRFRSLKFGTDYASIIPSALDRGERLLSQVVHLTILG